jgi:hypothetical protein
MQKLSIRAVGSTSKVNNPKRKVWGFWIKLNPQHKVEKTLTPGIKPGANRF